MLRIFLARIHANLHCLQYLLTLRFEKAVQHLNYEVKDGTLDVTTGVFTAEKISEIGCKCGRVFYARKGLKCHASK